MKVPKKKKNEVMPAIADLFPSEVPLPPTRTLEEGQRFLQAQIGEGVPCPCCCQLVKLYRRRFNTTMARGLLWLCTRSGPTFEWVEYAKTAPRWLVSKGGTFALLAHWGLIECQTNEDESTRTSGIWRPTQDGWDVAHGKRVVPIYIFLYDNRKMAFSNTFMGIEAALGEGFDYAELMKPILSMKGTISKDTQAPLFPGL